MLKCRIKKGSRSVFHISGTAGELANETCLIINQIYQYAKKHAPDAAEHFREKLLILLLAPDSPVWKENIND